MSSMIEGRGLFYGATGNSFAHRKIFSSNGQIRGTDSWDATCRQAKAWGIQWLHPKVADGGNWWYELADLHMLVTIAHGYGLKVAPYHYCYGNKFGYLVGEADIAATIASIFDGCCPDIEVEWDGQAQWAIDFGHEVRRKAPHGLFVPTLYPDPYTVWGPNLTNATPYAQLSSWMDAWMPMAYFSVWTTGGHPDTAQNAIDFLFPQWSNLNTHIEHMGFTPRPILPLIELGSALPPQEVYTWIAKMDHYGYCGFWYDGQMTAEYAQAIDRAPIPAFPHANPQPEPQPQPEPPPQPYNPPLVTGPGLKDEPGEPDMNQNLTLDQLATIWHQNGTTMAMNLNFGIPKLWAALIQKHPDWLLSGPSQNSETPFQLGGEKGTYVDFDSRTGGMRIWYFSSTGTLAVSGSSSQGPTSAKIALADIPSQPTRVEMPIVTVSTHPHPAALPTEAVPIVSVPAV